MCITYLSRDSCRNLICKNLDLLLTGMVSIRGSGRIDGQVTSVSEAGRVRLCGHVTRSYVGCLEYPDQRVGVRTGATSSA